MTLNEVHRGINKNRKRKRVGRGPGSGHGKFSTRGRNGAGSRAGSSPHAMFAGGQTRMWQTIPKRGFNNKFAKSVVVVNVADLEQAFAAGDEVTVEVLSQRNIAKGRFDQLKVLGEGELTKKLRVAAHRFSKSAVEKIQAAGGEVIIVPGPIPVSEKQPPRRERAKKA